MTPFDEEDGNLTVVGELRFVVVVSPNSPKVFIPQQRTPVPTAISSPAEHWPCSLGDVTASEVRHLRFGPTMAQVCLGPEAIAMALHTSPIAQTGPLALPAMQT
jgi:hypothetical protein